MKPWPPKRTPGLRAAQPADDHATAPGTMRVKELVPIRLATQRVQSGPWTGFPLTSYEITPTLYGGAAMLIKLGSESPVGETVRFVPQFAIRLPFADATALNAPEARAEAEQVAQMYITILNDWRKA